jgi:hypothetical protein
VEQKKLRGVSEAGQPPADAARAACLQTRRPRTSIASKPLCGLTGGPETAMHSRDTFPHAEVVAIDHHVSRTLRFCLRSKVFDQATVSI